MTNTEDMRDAEKRRLAWRCRRGMLELDIVLQNFVEHHFSDLTIGELGAFDEMLGLPDNEFWNMLQKESTHQKTNNQQSVIKKMHSIQSLSIGESVYE